MKTPCLASSPYSFPLNGYDPCRASSREQWGIRTQPVDYFDAQGDLEALLQPLQATFEAAPHPAFHPGRSASVSLAGALVGHIGELHPKWVREYGLPSAPVMFEIEVAPIALLPRAMHAGVSKFPPVFRDISLVLRAAIPAAAVLATLKAASAAHVTKLEVFDHYRPSKPDSGLAARNHPRATRRLSCSRSSRSSQAACAGVSGTWTPRILVHRCVASSGFKPSLISRPAAISPDRPTP